MAKRKRFFEQVSRPEDDLARQRDVEALLAPRRVISQDIPIDRIQPNPFQARKQFEGIDEMAQAILSLGFTTRLRVRPDPQTQGMFQLVFGERRLLAAKQAELTEVPCDVADHSDEELIEIGLAENIQRRDLVPLEEARAFQTFIDQRGYTIRGLAERIGKDKGYVENRLVLLRTPEDVQEMVEQRPDTIRAAREIAKIPTADEREPLIEGILSGELSKDDVRTIVGNSESAKKKRNTEYISAYKVSQALERDKRALRNMFARWDGWLMEEQIDQEAVLESISQLLEHAYKLSEAVKNKTSSMDHIPDHF